MEEVLKEIGITRKGEYSKRGSYVIDMEDSDDFGRMYSILDKNKDVEELGDNAINNIHTINLIYLYGDYQLNLTADFDADKYMLIVTKLDDSEEDE